MKYFILLFLCLFGYVYGVINSKYLTMIGKKTCMKPLGCFEITSDFFNPLKRLINVLPQHRNLINTQFFLYTSSNPRHSYTLNTDNIEHLKSSPLKVNYPTRFIVHGLLDNKFFAKWQELLKDELLLGNKGNVIIVDWSAGNAFPYIQAAANSRVVGAEIAYLIETLEKTVGFNRSNAHIIGHSLGAHIAGYAGERLPGLGRITGLDPAEPLFQGLPPSVRLDETDARFVDVIHTDSKSILLLGLGMSQAIGHVDFYPNNGKNQPGCIKSKFVSIFTEGLIESSRRFIACNHQRAVDFFHWSINNNHCRLVGYKCASWDQFLEGKCTDCGPDGSLCSTMGIRADERKTLNQTNVKLYLKTSGNSPFCLQHYKIVFKLHKSKQATAVKGSVAIELHGDKDNVLTKLTGGSTELHLGSTHFYLATTDKNLVKIKSVLFSWTDSSSLLNPINWLRSKKLYLEYIEVIPMNVVDKIEQRSLTTKLCPTDPFKPIYSKKTAVLLEVNCKN